MVASSEVMSRWQSFETDEKNHNILITGLKKNYIGLHVKCPIFSPILTKSEFYPQIILKVSSVKFHENPSSGSCKGKRGRMERHDEANMHFLGPMRAHLKILHSAQVAHLHVFYESKNNRDYFPVNN